MLQPAHQIGQSLPQAMRQPGIRSAHRDVQFSGSLAQANLHALVLARKVERDGANHFAGALRRLVLWLQKRRGALFLRGLCIGCGSCARRAAVRRRRHCESRRSVRSPQCRVPALSRAYGGSRRDRALSCLCARHPDGRCLLGARARLGLCCHLGIRCDCLCCQSALTRARRLRRCQTCAWVRIWLCVALRLAGAAVRIFELENCYRYSLLFRLLRLGYPLRHACRGCGLLTSHRRCRPLCLSEITVQPGKPRRGNRRLRLVRRDHLRVRRSR